MIELRIPKPAQMGTSDHAKRVREAIETAVGLVIDVTVDVDSVLVKLDDASDAQAVVDALAAYVSQPTSMESWKQAAIDDALPVLADIIAKHPNDRSESEKVLLALALDNPDLRDAAYGDVGKAKEPPA